ncbi:unnamed protein product, partial [Phaeothamnion confervicola]
RIAESRWTDRFIVFVLFLNMVMLVTMYEGSSGWLLDLQATSNTVFAVVFAVEAAVKIAGLGSSCYFRTPRHAFDFAVTVVALLETAVSASDTCGGYDIAALRLVRSFRVFRIMRLAAFLPGFGQVWMAATYPIHTLVNVFLVLSIDIFIFANAGVALFSDANLSGGLNLYANFDSVWGAMQLLFVCATGDGWSDTMRSVLVATATVPILTYAFFFSFMVVTMFLLTNMFIMVIVEAFEVLNAEERKDLERLIPKFRSIWSRFDPRADGSIPAIQLHAFLMALPQPLGAG